MAEFYGRDLNQGVVDLSSYFLILYCIRHVISYEWQLSTSLAFGQCISKDQLNMRRENTRSERVLLKWVVN